MASTSREGEWDLRARFNRLRISERAAAGELLEIVEQDGHPAQPLAREPFCTRSQLLAYFDVIGGKLEEVARAHRYLRADGTLGLSGKPDPKTVKEGDVLYRLQK